VRLYGQVMMAILGLVDFERAVVMRLCKQAMVTILCKLVAGIPNLEQETVVGTSLKLTWMG